jgi:hypothetical protein
VNGLLKSLLRLGCLVVLILVAIGIWWFHAPIGHALTGYLGRRSALPPITDTSVGAPTPRALQSTEQKLERLKQPASPDSVILSANEIASMIGSGLDWSVRKSFDSLRVELHEGSVAVYCRLDTRVIPPDALGPLTGMLNPTEPLRIAGPVRIERPGVARWRIDELALRGIPFPGPMVKQLAKRMAGADSTGAVPLRVSPNFSDVAVHPTGVVLYRHRR